ncbi:hypothetical protein N0V90_008958 [Kalmusia sp. IMI 367209]|nr:hypothetical protein N0V90_008958 [Kalmusia sp. IMI 367209]
MADVAVSAQLRQCSASSPDLSYNEPETLRIDAAAVHAAATSLESQDASTFQERYLSSEEDLSPMDGNSSDDDYDSDVSIHEAEPNFFKARTMSISRWDKGKSCDMAVTVSYVSAGRPKMIELATSPVRETPQRSASLAQLPMTAINKLRQQDQQARRSLIVKSSSNRSISPAMSIEPRRPSTGSGPSMQSNKSALLLSDSRSGSSLQSGDSTSRSSSPSVSEKSTTSTRPVSAAGLPRSSLYVVSSARDTNPLAPFPPLTPQSPAGSHAFLSSDPYENSTTNAASPIIKSAPHKRLRSISMKLSLAKIAITPSTKKWDSRVNGRAGNMPPTPSTPYTPMTPQTAPLPTSTPMNKLRRNSRMLSRPGTARGPSPDIPPVPAVTSPSPRKVPVKRMVARGADEREPILELPPCPDEASPASAVSSIKSRRIRKRKSLMDLL